MAATPPVAIAEGDHSVAIAAPIKNTVIVAGNRNTVEMRLEGAGAVLAFAFRWNRPRRRRRRDRRPPPPPFPQHVDRDEEIQALLGRDG